MIVVTLLGTADAAGIPVHGCNAPACQEAFRYPWLRRLQTCILVQTEQASILVDMGSDRHMQNLFDVYLDAVFVTHLHLDHVAGLAALRWTQQPGGLPVYYPKGGTGDGAWVIEPEVVEQIRPQPMARFAQKAIKDLSVTAVPLNHGDTITHGYLIEAERGSVAVLLDTRGLPEETFAFLTDHRPDLAIVDSTSSPGRASGGHNDVIEALATIQKLDVKRGVLSHIAPHNWPYRELLSYVHERDGNRSVVAYDGMMLAV